MRDRFIDWLNERIQFFTEDSWWVVYAMGLIVAACFAVVGLIVDVGASL